MVERGGEGARGVLRGEARGVARYAVLIYAERVYRGYMVERITRGILGG
jgi:hypothetical protein